MPERRPLSVLVVDDHEDVRFLVRTVLADDPGVVVVGEASNAPEGIRLLSELAPDVVLLDARMPVIDGFEAAPLILAERPGQSILLLTTIVDDDIRRRAREAGIRACMEKCDFDDLAAALKALAAPPLAA